jgi:hypothetical protein
MRMWQRLKFWRLWIRREAREADLERELRDHLQLEAEEQQAAGLSPREAAFPDRQGQRAKLGIAPSTLDSRIKTLKINSADLSSAEAA